MLHVPNNCHATGIYVYMQGLISHKGIHIFVQFIINYISKLNYVSLKIITQQ